MPLLQGVRDLALQGLVTGASARNWAAYGHEVEVPESFAAVDQALLSDPQTSGGLLVSCTAQAVGPVLEVFRRHGFAAATEIGSVTACGATPCLVLH